MVPCRFRNGFCPGFLPVIHRISFDPHGEMALKNAGGSREDQPGDGQICEGKAQAIIAPGVGPVPGVKCSGSWRLDFFKRRQIQRQRLVRPFNQIGNLFSVGSGNSQIRNSAVREHGRIQRQSAQSGLAGRQCAAQSESRRGRSRPRSRACALSAGLSASALTGRFSSHRASTVFAFAAEARAASRS